MASRTEPKKLLFAHFAAVAGALAHGHRLELLEQLAQRELAVEPLAERIGLSVANASQHLQRLRRAGLVTTRRRGKNVVYRLADGPIVEALAALREIAERNLGEARDVIRTYFSDRDAMEPISREELVTRLRAGDTTLLDVRPEDEFAGGHLPGAVNIGLRTLGRRLSELPRDREIIAYCRGPYCLLSFQAVDLLREKGYRVRRLRDGFPEWKAAGLEVASG